MARSLPPGPNRPQPKRAGIWFGKSAGRRIFASGPNFCCVGGAIVAIFTPWDRSAGANAPPGAWIFHEGEAKKMSRGLTEVLESWDSVHSSELYGVEAWGNGFFHVTEDGFAAVRLKNSAGPVSVKFHDIVQGLYQRGFSLPILLRFGDLLAARLRTIHEAFGKAIAESGYAGCYRGVYPIKVNQQQQTVADVVKFGRELHHGLEAGSKAELIAALAYLHDPEAYIVCNPIFSEDRARSMNSASL